MLVTPFRNRDARQAGAVMEGLLPDAGDAIRNRDARQAGALLKASSPMLVTGLPSMVSGMTSSPVAAHHNR